MCLLSSRVFISHKELAFGLYFIVFWHFVVCHVQSSLPSLVHFLIQEFVSKCTLNSPTWKVWFWTILFTHAAIISKLIFKGFSQCGLDVVDYLRLEMTYFKLDCLHQVECSKVIELTSFPAQGPIRKSSLPSPFYPRTEADAFSETSCSFFSLRWWMVSRISVTNCFFPPYNMWLILNSSLPENWTSSVQFE
jgi:hypothetical protein